jgi:hypothetical protein
LQNRGLLELTQRGRSAISLEAVPNPLSGQTVQEVETKLRGENDDLVIN